MPADHDAALFLSPATAYAGAMVGEPSDEALMLNYADGDAAAFEILYGRHKSRLYRYLLRQCGVRATADELFQDVWTRVIAARSGYRVSARFTTWLYTIAHHRLIDHYRRHGRLPSSYEDLPDAHPDQTPSGAASDPARGADARRQVERLLELLAALPAAQREAWLLREESGLGLDQIAAATGVKRETAKSRLRYAGARLRAGLGLDS